MKDANIERSIAAEFFNLFVLFHHSEPALAYVEFMRNCSGLRVQNYN